MEPVRVLFYVVLGIFIVAFILFIYNALIENLTKIAVKQKQISTECLQDCSKCANQAECETAECAWEVDEKNVTKGECKRKQ